MKSFFIMFTGCARRQLDCERIKNYLMANGLAWADSPQKADYIIVSTCGLSEYFEDFSISKIRLAQNYAAQLIVYGCMPAMNLEKIREIFKGPIVLTKQIEEFDHIFPEFSIRFNEVPDANRAYVEPVRPVSVRFKEKIKSQDLYYPLKFYNTLTTGIDKFLRRNHHPVAISSSKHMVIGNSRYLIDHNNQYITLRISTGCLGNCSYCTIRKAIGRLKSKPVETILEELRRRLDGRGCRLNIISSDTGPYGLDIGTTLPDLLKSILAEDKRIIIHFIQDLHPAWICRYKDELAELISGRRIKSILTAIQSGSDNILKSMRRPANLEEFGEVLERFRKANPRLRLRTQVIVGFPSETEADFQQTISALKALRFDEVDIFRYHETPQMDSARMFPKVPKDVIEDRILRLIDSLPISVTRHYHKNI